MFSDLNVHQLPQNHVQSSVFFFLNINTQVVVAHMVPILEEKAKLALEGLFAGVVCGDEKDEEEVNETSNARKTKRKADPIGTVSSL